MHNSLMEDEREAKRCKHERIHIDHIKSVAVARERCICLDCGYTWERDKNRRQYVFINEDDRIVRKEKE